ncbi:adenylate kinase family protein [Candidatus Woesearchaeota archaeon]|nr:adenylate kinase family protein [Candidatus Woesearchaeota archaeon]
MTIIAVTGTPCTGKTSLATALAKELGYEYVDVAQVIKANHLEESYDEERQCAVVDTEKLVSTVCDMLRKGKNYVIDSHLSHYLPNTLVDLCIVTKCDLKTLKQRLEDRNYSKYKVRENLDAEIFDVCLVEAMEEQEHEILVVDTTHYLDVKKTAEDVLEIIEKRKSG